MNKLKELLVNLNIDYKDIEIYEKAFTHMSFINETSRDVKDSYERLEFLGDSVLGLIVSEFLTFSLNEMLPGEMTLLRSNLVNKKSLSTKGRELNFNPYIQIGKGEDPMALSDSVIEDVFEALVGAIYIDRGFEEAKKFVNSNISKHFSDFDVSNIKDYKTKLQELLQNENRANITYKTIGQKMDSDNVNIFTVKVIFDGIALGTGMGTSKKKAEQLAARDAFDKLESEQ